MFGREERFENPGQGFFIHSPALVGDSDGELGQVGPDAFHQDGPRPVHGLTGIEDQVQQGAEEKVLVTHDLTGLLVDLDNRIDLFRKGCSSQEPQFPE